MLSYDMLRKELWNGLLLHNKQNVLHNMYALIQFNWTEAYIHAWTGIARQIWMFIRRVLCV